MLIGQYFVNSMFHIAWNFWGKSDMEKRFNTFGKRTIIKTKW